MSRADRAPIYRSKGGRFEAALSGYGARFENGRFKWMVAGRHDTRASLRIQRSKWEFAHTGESACRRHTSHKTCWLIAGRRMGGAPLSDR